MTIHSSARTREPHVNRTTRTATIVNALKERALSVLNDKSIDPESRAILRYALKTNDPWLAQLLRRAEVDQLESNEDDSSEKIEALAEIICRAGDESAAALFVLMGMLQNSTEPKVIANTVKHLAFTRCGELNVYGMVDAQVAVVEGELLAHMS